MMMIDLQRRHTNSREEEPYQLTIIRYIVDMTSVVVYDVYAHSKTYSTINSFQFLFKDN